MGLTRNAYAGPVVHCLHDEPVSAGDLYEEMHEALFAVFGGKDRREVWAPNIPRSGKPRDFFVESGGECPTDLPLTPEIMAAEVAWMTAAYAPEIEILRKHYRSVEVQWRVMGWTE